MQSNACHVVRKCVHVLSIILCHAQVDSPSIHLLPVSEYASSSLRPTLHQVASQTASKHSRKRHNVHVLIMCSVYMYMYVHVVSTRSTS